MSRRACRSFELIFRSSLTLAPSPPLVTVASCCSSCCIRAALRSRTAFCDKRFLNRLDDISLALHASCFPHAPTAGLLALTQGLPAMSSLCGPLLALWNTMATDREQRVGAGSNPSPSVTRVTHVARPKDVDRLSDEYHQLSQPRSNAAISLPKVPSCLYES